MLRQTLVTLTLTAVATANFAQVVNRFDGKWDVTIVCHAAKVGSREIRPYAMQMAGVVLDGQFAALTGIEGKPGWSYLHGGIDNDGNALLWYESILTDKSFSMSEKINVGDKIGWQATATFNASSGTAARIEGRRCDLKFAKRPSQ